MVLSVRKRYNHTVYAAPAALLGQIEFGENDMKRKISTLILIMMLCISTAVMTACGGGPVGFWQIDEVNAGDVVMTEDDAESFGIATIGSVKLQKSGKCVVTIIGEEQEGTWEQAEDGTITINYGDNMTMTGSIGEDNIMTLTDTQGSEYKLSK